MSSPQNAVKDAEQAGRASEGRGAAEQDGRSSEGREAAVKALEELMKKEGLKGLLSLFEKVEATRQEWEDFIPSIVLIACGAAETAVSESEDESETAGGAVDTDAAETTKVSKSEDESGSSEDEYAQVQRYRCSCAQTCCQCGMNICEAEDFCTCDALCDCCWSDDQESEQESDEEDD